jgi:squalene-hopene/tetraprenyl-beta-curcumene cyclase
VKSANTVSQSPRISRREFNFFCPLAIGAGAFLATGASFAEVTGDALGPDPKKLKASIDQAIGYLQTRGQGEDGSFSKRAGIGVTMLVATAAMRNGRTANDPMVAKSLKCIEACVRPDGGIYTKGGMIANYETCLAIMCFQQANTDKRYDALLRSAEAFVKGTQWGKGTATETSDVSFGGVGYGKRSRPDLSNTAYLVDALKASGRGPDDEAMKQALVFVSRCQNLESENNTTPFAAKNPDGGFYYSCAGDGENAAGKTANGGLRSYAAMTYSGLKSMIYAGVKPDDPRVKAATQWIRKNYALKTNPGLGTAGLFYYYNVFAKTLDALGEDRFADADGKKHDWRRELAEELFRQQKENGSWVNENNKWLESDPNLATGFALMALSYCRPAAAK